MKVTVVAMVLLLWLAGCADADDDRDVKAWVMETNTLPMENSTGRWLLDLRKMAALGNGHVATVVYSHVVYMNGLYNGPVGWSHRAAIQSIHDIEVKVQDSEVTRMYSMDVWKAVFSETLRAESVMVSVMTYAHQRLVQLMVTEIHVTRTSGQVSEVSLKVQSSRMKSTPDLTLDEQTVVHDIEGCQDGRCRHTRGQTLISETEWAPLAEVSVYWTEVPSTLTLPAQQKEATWFFLSSYDKDPSKARKTFQTALTLLTSTPDLLRHTHEAAWEDKWNDGSIDVEGDDDLASVIHASLYYILMSLPSTQPSLPLSQFFGLSPGSLARGANWTDYQGHVFWDMETWMYPTILMLFPELAREMLSYRIYGGEGARAKAEEHGYKGWMFPWESAFTGWEMTPQVCVPCREYEQHITGDVAFAARQFWASTRQVGWLREQGGARLIFSTADFWADRATYDAEKDRYDINGVMPPDEYAEHVNNSVYTNYAAKINLEVAHYMACEAQQPVDQETARRRQDVAAKLYIVFNESAQHHPEYEGYDDPKTAWKHDQKVKQADVVMLGYPLGMKMADNVRENDLLLYESRGDERGPAMTWSMFCINWLRLGQEGRAARHFTKSYTPYTRPPFNTWTEVEAGVGATNFITGMGGFLQAVVFGYAGLTIDLERLTFHPRLPPRTRKLKVTGINYLGSTFDLVITEHQVLVVVRATSEEYPLQLKVTSSGTTWRLKEDMELVLGREPFQMTSLLVTECPLPRGTSCPDVASPADVTLLAPPLLEGNMQVVQVTQSGGDRCHDSITCAKAVTSLLQRDSSVNFYIGDDNRVYQGAALTSQYATLKVCMLGDYTLAGMSMEQQALLRRLIKCGMESEPAKLAHDYRLQFTAPDPLEECGIAPCAGNSLHCQLATWRHWDTGAQSKVAPNCSEAAKQALKPLTTQPPHASHPPRACQTQSSLHHDVTDSATAVTSLFVLVCTMAAMLISCFWSKDFEIF